MKNYNNKNLYYICIIYVYYMLKSSRCSRVFLICFGVRSVFCLKVQGVLGFSWFFWRPQFEQIYLAVATHENPLPAKFYISKKYIWRGRLLKMPREILKAEYKQLTVCMYLSMYVCIRCMLYMYAYVCIR